MTVLYNCKHAGDEYRITKFNDNMDVESSYLCTFTECDCPAGVRDTCRHRQMLPKFVTRSMVDTNWFYDYDRDGWVQTDLGEALSESVSELDMVASHTIIDEASSITDDMFIDCDDQAPPVATSRTFRRGL